MNRAIFFDSIRRTVFGGKLNAKQVDGLSRILDYRDTKYPKMSNDQLAYVLATAYWESAHTIQPIREAGGERYLRTKKYYPWVGEGLVQVTWEVNARKFGATKPGDLLNWPKALDALFRGMSDGMFTGRGLSEYINDKKRDYRSARRIVNGMDRADDIALIANAFRNALIDAQEKKVA